MQQYFLDDFLDIDKQVACITGQDAHHIIKVMRMRLDEEILIVIQATAYVAKIIELNESKKEVLVQAVCVETVARELPLHVTIALGLLKAEKFEYAIQKMTELGVSQIFPWQAERSVVKLKDKQTSKKIERWELIAKEASEQSKRLKIPEILQVATLSEIIKTTPASTTIYVAYEELATTTEKTKIKLATEDNVLFLIGPEGGISDKEVTLLKNLTKERTIHFVSLGTRILRAETAAIFAMSLCTAASENLL